MGKAKKIPYLNPEQPLGICLQKILRTRFNEMTASEEGTLKGEDIEFLHDMRVSSRRVQAVLKIFRAAFPKKMYKDEYAQVRLLIRSLGVVRDYDVFIDKLEKLKQKSSATDSRAIDMLIIRKKVERDAKRKLMVKTVNELNRIGYKENFMRFITTSVMKRMYPANKKLSLKENIQHILPIMFDDVMEYRNDVVSKPMAKSTLHRMRIAGKPLRYAMELGETAFGKDFLICHDEVKNTVELMGEIHDIDIMIPELASHLREIRMFNRTIPVFKDRVSTAQMREIINGLKQKRIEMYKKLCDKLNEWEKTKFKIKLMLAMGLNPPDNFVTAGGI